MSDQVSRFEDLERTDVLPQLGFEPADDDEGDTSATGLLVQSGSSVPRSERSLPQTVAPFGTGSQSSNGHLHTLPAKPSPTDLAVGGIRGKIADLENKLLEAQDHQTDLNRHCEQLTQRCRAGEERASRAEANFVVQASDLYRTTQRATDAEQRLAEQRVRFEAQIVETERQLVDARLRGDKRTGNLEQLLAEQTERAAQGERATSDVRMELEKARAELNASRSAIGGLEERLAEQTRTASEISRSYSQQTSQVSAINATLADNEKRIATLLAAKDESDRQVLTLEDQVRLSREASSKLQSDIDMQRRHISALEQGLSTRDSSIAKFQDAKDRDERERLDLTTAKAELERRAAALQASLTESQTSLAGKEQEVSRLTAIVMHHEVRNGELTAAKEAVDQRLRDRDATIAQEAARANAAQKEFDQAVDKLKTQRARLDQQEQTIDALQAKLQASSGEFEAAHEMVIAFQQREADWLAEKRKYTADFDGLQKTTQKVMAERDQLEMENQAGRAELSRSIARYEEAVQTIMVTRESISVREQQNASLERELRATASRLEEAQVRIERAASGAESFASEVRDRDSRIAMLEEKLMEHASALSAINQDIDRANSASPNERLAAIGYALESLDDPGVVHRLTRMTTTAGRSDSNDIPINSTSVSRYHARIVVKPEGVWLIDLQSTNGCGVNGRRTSRQILCDGDAVRIGHCTFRFSVLGADATKGNEGAHEIPLIEDPLLISSQEKKEGESRPQHH